MDIKDIVVVSACRTAMGKFGGTLRNLAAYDLGAVVIKEALKRASLNGDVIDDVILGSCRQAGNGPNPARTASVRGGVSPNTPVTTINMACPSGMRALALAAQEILTGDAKIIVVGGFDSMSSIPYLLKNARWDGFKMGNKVLEDGWSDSIDPLIQQGMGETAENLFDKYNITREEQDKYAVSSHAKASLAETNGWFNEEIVPVEIPETKTTSSSLFTKDENIRHNVNINDMAKLKPSFRKEGSVTAGNSCGLSDGASAMIVMHRSKALELGLKPLFSLVATAQVAVAPSTMGEGPAFAIPAALKKAGMTLDQMDIIEINEAFAVQVLSNHKILNFDMNKLNVNGGAIALGHPTGNSGSRIIVTAYHALKRLNKTYAIASICGGGGVSTATIIKRES